MEGYGKVIGTETWPEDPDLGPRRDQSGFIDFRYHLVSIVAVFLALAIGIVLGTDLHMPITPKTNGEGAPCLGVVAASGLLYSRANAAPQRLLQLTTCETHGDVPHTDKAAYTTNLLGVN